MAKKKSNPKPALIIIGIAIVVILCMFIAQPVLAWISENRGILLASLFAVVVVAVALFVWWYRERLKKRNEAFYGLETVIKKFEYHREFLWEEPYHSMLYGYLIGKGYKDIKYELQTGRARPDLVVDGIAIEVKGPTTSVALLTLADKVMKYSNHYKHLIIVLFKRDCGEDVFNETLMDMAKFVRGKVKLKIIVKEST